MQWKKNERRRAPQPQTCCVFPPEQQTSEAAARCRDQAGFHKPRRKKRQRQRSTPSRVPCRSLHCHCLSFTSLPNGSLRLRAHWAPTGDFETRGRQQLPCTFLHRAHPETMARATVEQRDEQKPRKKNELREQLILSIPRTATRHTSSVLHTHLAIAEFAARAQDSWNRGGGPGVCLTRLLRRGSCKS
jgi:hypothetical protein